MYILQTALVLASLASIPASANTEQGTKLLRMPLIRSPHVSKDILESVSRQYKSLQKRATYQAPLYNDQGSQYLIQVGIGTPSQNFTVTLDTGSADLWVPSTQCPSTSCPYARFDSTQSSTFNTLSQKFGIQYGIGSVNGTYVTDTVTVAGASVQNQQFGLASSTQDILTQSGSGSGGGNAGGIGDPLQSGSNSTLIADGILGLGYPQLTAATTNGGKAYQPFVFNLVQQNVIQDPVFSIYLNSINEEGWAGEIIFGGVDSSKYTGQIHYLPVAGLQEQSSNPFDSILGSPQQGYYYWMVYGQGVSVQNGLQNPTFTLSSTGAFILDTGTTLTYLPTDVAVEIAESIAGKTGYQIDSSSGVIMIDCSAASSSASVQLNMLSSSDLNSTPITLSVPASELVIPLDSNSASTATTCLFGIAPSGSSSGLSSNMFLVGDSFLRSAYLVFDMKNNQVGIAAANGVGGSVAGTTASDSETSSGAATTMTVHRQLLCATLILLLALFTA